MRFPLVVERLKVIDYKQWRAIPGGPPSESVPSYV
jgi:hypothetical protein